MGNKLSFTQINTYTTCGYKYFQHYVQKKRSKYFHGALAFGSAVDESLNFLLKAHPEVKLDESKAVFDKKWFTQWVNGQNVALPEYENLVYADTDYDADLLQAEDLVKLQDKLKGLNLGDDVFEAMSKVQELKKEVGYKQLHSKVLKFYNYANWLTMRRKGHVMLESYAEKVLPRIREVKAVQLETKLVNAEGDEVVQYLDLIVEWEDGRIVLMDNKTSARKYDEDSAGTSQQLVSYFYQSKESFQLTHVGFIVLGKQILKNKIKTCTKCGNVAEEGSRVKTCAVELEPGVKKSRCNGEFDVVCDPECYIDVIINDVTEHAQDLVLSTFDEANHGITSQHWYKNLAACKNGSIICPFYASCWKGDESELVVLKKESK